MRMTLDIDDDVLAVAKVVAAYCNRSVGAVISDFARLGARAGGHPRLSSSGFPTFDVEPDARKITSQIVADALEEE